MGLAHQPAGGRDAQVVLLSFAVRTDVFRRHQPSFVAKRMKLATEMMRADARFHPAA
jgi:hypothetical protein